MEIQRFGQLPSFASLSTGVKQTTSPRFGFVSLSPCNTPQKDAKGVNGFVIAGVLLVVLVASPFLGLWHLATRGKSGKPAA